MRFPLPLAAVIPIALACGVTDNTQASPLDLTTEANPAELAVGDTARIHIEITNSGDRTVWIGPAGCNYDFVITAASGTVYHPAEKVYCTLALQPPVKLEPGDSYEIEAFTTGRVVRQGSQDGPIMLAPGTYGIRAVVAVLKGDESEIVVKSDPSMVTFQAASE